MLEPIHATEERVAKIYCPDCGWMKTIRADGPTDHEHAPELSCAECLADGDVRAHVSQREYSDGETHTPLVFTADAVYRFEPDQSALVR
jgi:predicted RNA-binding Zn-ribbon protein involved in translation (DUF1610 family)